MGSDGPDDPVGAVSRTTQRVSKVNSASRAD